MFAKSDKNRGLTAGQIEVLRRTVENGNKASVIGADATVLGDVESTGDLQIFGMVEGEVRGRTLVIEDGAHIEGRVIAEQLLIGGSVHGVVTATDVGVEGTARVVGNIIHNSLTIQPGAILEGRRPWRPRPVKA